MAKERVREIDLLRSLAIVLMVVYHTAYDLRVFYNWHIDLFGVQWELLRIVTVSLFLFASGVAANFSTRPLRRALIVLGCALLITIATYVYDPSVFIYFGILHCIGLSMLLLIPLKQLREWNIFLGLTIIISHFAFPMFNFPIRPTLDYYPIIPWFGVMLIGAGVGHYLYIRKSYHFPLSSFLSPLSIPGRHSLLIYLVHQPIILAVLWLIL